MLEFSMRGDSLVWPLILLSTGFWQVTKRFLWFEVVVYVIVIFSHESVQKKTHREKADSNC